MFFTRSANEDPLGSLRSGYPDARGWRCFSLAVEDSFWIVTYRVEERDEGILLRQTVFVADDRNLIEVVKDLRRNASGMVNFIGRMRPDKTWGWAVDEVAELWLPASDEPTLTKTVLLHVMRSDNTTFNSFGRKVPNHWPGRELLQRIPERMSDSIDA